MIPATNLWLVVVCCLIVGFLCAFILIDTRRTSIFPEDDGDTLPPDAIDPWEMQRQLMRASDQPCPEDGPALTKASFLYAALMLEELGETITALTDLFGLIPIPVKRLPGGVTAIDTSVTTAIRKIHESLIAVAAGCDKDSQYLRELLTQVPEMYIPIKPEAAVALLDGTTDVAVVNCGFALACGLPGAQAYDEVTSSNLSKINPGTNKISKTPDGKWIKGPNYFKPDLLALLRDDA